VLDSDEIVELPKLPRSLAVIGAGVIGVEYATIFSALDVPVTLIEPRPTFLDFIDKELIDEFVHELRDRNVALRLGSKVVSIERSAQGPVMAHLASLTEMSPEQAVCAASGNNAKVSALGDQDAEIQDIELVAEAHDERHIVINQ
jgi:NAD(P) transhydrogenase